MGIKKGDEERNRSEPVGRICEREALVMDIYCFIVTGENCNTEIERISRALHSCFQILFALSMKFIQDALIL
jgi:hypothetical protein